MKSTRQEQIVRLISERGTISVEQASAEVDASPATIRRDFNDLAERGLVERVRGGVRTSEPGLMVPFAVREIQQVDEKLLIARRAAQLMSPGDVVFIDGGTTTLQLAACLPLIPLRIITNSLRFAGEIERRTQQRTLWEVFLTGGFFVSRIRTVGRAKCSNWFVAVSRQLGDVVLPAVSTRLAYSTITSTSWRANAS